MNVPIGNLIQLATRNHCQSLNNWKIIFIDPKGDVKTKLINKLIR